MGLAEDSWSNCSDFSVFYQKHPTVDVIRSYTTTMPLYELVESITEVP
jgi:hypothetical protein